MSGRPGARLLVAPLLVVLCLAALAAIVGSPAGGAQSRNGVAVSRPVQGVTLVCPSVPAQSADVVTRTEVATSRPGDGTALVESLQPVGQPPPATPLPQQEIPLTAAVSPVTLPAGPPLVITATGPASGGVVATRVTRGDQGPERGYAVDTCTAPRTDAWFVGASTAPGQDATLEITNVDDSPAEIDVKALTKDGIVTPVTATGRVIPPRSSVDLPLDQIAPNEPSTAVEVVAVRGRIASALREHRGLNALKPGGVDAVPEALTAERTVTLAGIVGAVGNTLLDGSRMHHVLSVGVPGVTDATVRVSVTDDSGTFTPSGLDQLPVAAGTVRQIDLDQALTAERALIQVTSDEGVPLVAGVLIDAQARFGDTHETLQVGAAVPLNGPSVFPDARVAAGENGHTDTFLSVASLVRQAQVTVTTGGQPDGITIPEGRIAEVKAHDGSPGDTPLFITPMPGSPPVYAAATIEELGLNGPLLSGAAVSGGLASVLLPPAFREPALPLVDSRR